MTLVTSPRTSYSSQSSSVTLHPRMLSTGALVWVSCRPLLKMSALQSNPRRSGFSDNRTGINDIL